MDNVTTIIVAVIGSGILNTIVNRIFSNRDKKNNSDAVLKKSIRLIMQNQIRNQCNHYIAQGWLYTDELEELITMHSCYHDDLKGNGFLDALMEKVKKLDVKGIGVN